MATITGTAGNDTLNGTPSYDESDEFFITTGNDSINGLAGADYLRFDNLAGPVSVNLATGTASFGINTTLFSGIEGALGSQGNDTMVGSALDDTMGGYLGNDSMNGGGGIDTLTFYFSGGPVQVNLAATSGTLNVTGSEGNDTVTGFENVEGSEFADSITGSSGNNLINGLGGNDTLRGGLGYDTLSYEDVDGAVQVNLATSVVGGAADSDDIAEFEAVTGTSFDDSVVGDGADNIIAGGSGNDTLDGGDGFDTLDYRDTKGGGVTVNLGAGTVAGGAGADSISGFEAVLGSSLNDKFIGGGAAAKFEGLGGNDTLSGNAGNDTLLGGDGSDALNGWMGNDIIDGGASKDFYWGTDQNSVWYGDSTSGIFLSMSGVTGDGSVGTGLANDGLGGMDTLANVHWFTGSGYNDTMLGSGAAIYEEFEGGQGDDILNGGAYETVYLDGFNAVIYRNSPGAVTIDLRAGTATGGSGNDTLLNFHSVVASSYADTLFGSDTTQYTEQFQGRNGNDTIDGRGGRDTVRYGYVDNATSTGVYVNLVTGEAIAGVGDVDTLINIERVRGSKYNDTLIGGNEANGVDISGGFESFRGEGGNDSIDGGIGLDQIEFGNSTGGVYVVLGGAETGFAYDGMGGIDTLISIEYVFGSFYDDFLIGSDSAELESFEGQIGNDTIDGKGGMDRVDYYSSRAAVNVNLATGVATEYYFYGGTTAGTDALSNIEWVRGSENFGDVLTGNSIANKLEGIGGNDTLDGGAGIDTMEGGNGSDTYHVRDVGDVVTEYSSFLGLGGKDTVFSYITSVMSGAGVVLGDFVENLRIVTSAAANGSGNSLNNIITAGVGDNVLNGKAGLDTISYSLATTAVTASIDGSATGAQVTGGSGSDTLLNFENITGGSGNDTLTGSAAANVLSGGLGADSMIGGLGKDTYVVDNVSDKIVESSALATEIDEVNSSVTYSLAALANVENLGLTGASTAHATGNALANVLTGNSGANSLIGSAGNDTLDGGLGNDTMIGNADNDSYVVNAAGDVVVELSGEGVDLVRASISYSLVDTDGAGANGGNVENLHLLGATAINGTGNSLNNVIYAGTGDNQMDGGAGNDTVSYAFATRPISVNLSLQAGTAQGTGGSGSDKLLNFENLEGSAYNDSLSGDANANKIYGLAGNDSIFSGAGNDSIYGGAGGDYIAPGADASSSAWIDGGIVLDLFFGVDMNQVDYVGSAVAVSINASGFSGTGSTGSGTVSKGGLGNDTLVNVNQYTGSNLGDTFIGSSANFWERFQGRAGDDVINGGAITDLLNLTNGNRVVYTEAGTGVNVNLATGVVTGGAGNDQLTNINEVQGSNSNDTLTGSSFIFEQFEGRGGNDTIDGGTGNDRVRYNNASSAVYVDLAAGYALDGQGGRDTLLNVELVRGSNFADVLLGGSTLNGVGATDGFESFDGLGGNDTIDGGAGYDRVEYYGVTTQGVKVTLGGSANGVAYDGQGGVDTLINIEAARGSFYDDRLNGSDTGAFESFEGMEGNDSIDGKGGVDRVEYSQSKSAVTVNLTTGTASDGYGGTDKLLNIENVKASTFNDNITGSTVNNRLEGQAGHDTLKGEAGNDTMFGGAGNDLYYVQQIGDAVSEDSVTGSGTDTVYSYLTAYTLTTNVENLRLMATVNANGTGNASNNVITGNAFANGLSGAGGNDTLIGGAGVDTLTGGAGNDRFDFDAIGDSLVATPDRIADFASGFDEIDLSTIDADTTGGVNDAFVFSSGTAAPTFVAGDNKLYYHTTTGLLYGNNDGDVAADFVIQIVGAPTLLATDLVL